MTDFRAKSTIMGLAGLTAVFGMGTGGAPPVSSPEISRGGCQAPSTEGGSEGWSHQFEHCLGCGGDESNHSEWDRSTDLLGSSDGFIMSHPRPDRGRMAAAGRGGQAVGC